MRGKAFLLVVVVCVSFVQVRGDEEMDKKIKEAVNGVRTLLNRPYWETSFFDNYVSNSYRQYERLFSEYLAEATKQYFDFREFLYYMADFVKSETSDQTTYPCINKVRETFSDKAKNVTTKLGSSLQAEYLRYRESNFKEESYALERTTDYEYHQSKRRITNCTTVSEVNEAVRYYGHFYFVVVKSLQKTGREFRSFVRSVDAKTDQHLREYNTNFAILKTDSVDEMRKCILPKAAISGNSNLLQLLTAK